MRRKRDLRTGARDAIPAREAGRRRPLARLPHSRRRSVGMADRFRRHRSAPCGRRPGRRSAGPPRPSSPTRTSTVAGATTSTFPATPTRRHACCCSSPRRATEGARAGARLRVSSGTSAARAAASRPTASRVRSAAFMGVGRWMRFGGWCRPHTEVTATAGRALAPSRLTATRPGDRRRLAVCPSRGSVPDGSWGSYWWTSPHYTTLQAVELALGAGRSRRSLRARPSGPIRSQADDGGWSAPGGRDLRLRNRARLCLSS